MALPHLICLHLSRAALKRVMDNGRMELEIIINPKVTDKGDAVIQLETAAGAAIKHFKLAHGINVPRSRFLPVKSCSDLLLIKSDIYSLEHGELVINPERMFGTTPVITLADSHFKKVSLRNFRVRPLISPRFYNSRSDSSKFLKSSTWII
jgi:UTP--glucose-1-phosphate uridylyltransferase